ncbi:MAG: sugar phosphate isomerase/epimerase [Muribaculaceae bacterium]|nr:sugar phosphate isomerase/epimerase [Muribaculaceae bacterium]
MRKWYLVPDREDMERENLLAKEYGCFYEFNDFYAPAVLDDVRRQEEIIDHYARYRSDFSQDMMHGAFLDITVHSSDTLIREASMLRVRQSMEIAKRMGLRGVIFHTGRLGGFRAESYLRQWQEMNARFFTRLAEEYPGQQIYMENMFDEAPDVLAALAGQLKEVDNFGVCLDYAHASLQREPLEMWVKTLAPYIRHLHVNDNDLKNDLHKPMGTGRIDWQLFGKLMENYQVDASMLIEVKGYEAQKESLTYMRQHETYPVDKI